MSELLEFLTHPSRWNSVGDLPARQRVFAALSILVLTVAVMAVTRLIIGRLLRRRDTSTSAVAQAAIRVQRGVVALVAFVGFYLALEVAPLTGRLESALSGTAFVLGVLVAARVVIHLMAVLVGTSVTHVQTGERERLEREYVPLVRKATALAVSLIVVIVVAKHFGQDVTSLVAALGVGSLAIGLAAQQTLGNMIAGFTLLVDRPFRSGDRIQLSTGEVGEVQEIGVRSTRIVMATRNLLIVPNAELVNSRVINFHMPTASARGEVRVGVAYGSDLDKATRILEELARADERVAKDPAPVSRVTKLADSSIELWVGYELTMHTDALAVEDRLRRELLKRFAAENIDVPFPRMDVQLKQR